MGAAEIDAWWIVRVVAAAVVLVGVSIVALRILGVDRWREPAWAVLRGAVQLTLLALVLAGIIGNGWLVAAFLVVMMVAATLIASRRSGGGRRTIMVTAAAIVAGTVVSGTVVFGTGAVEFSSRYLLAVGGILIGGAMTIAGVGGLTLRRTLDDRWDEVEGWLALGATPRQATIRLARTAASTALTPLVDQTKSTGIVVLPGTFVGAIFGGLSPLDAGLFQITVLGALIASGSVVVLVLMLGLTARVERPVAPPT